MLNTIRHLRAPLALSAALIAGACADSKKSDGAGDALATDTAALNRDLALAGRDSAAQPALNDVPAAAEPAPAAPRPRATTSAPRPRTTTPTPAPRPRTTPSGNTVESNTAAGSRSGGGSVGTIAAGSTIAMTSDSRVCTNTYKVGQTFTATVSESVAGSNGATIPSGSTAKLEVTQVDRSENANDRIHMSVRLVSVNVNGRSYSMSGPNTEMNVDRVRNQPRNKDAQKVVTGAVIGGILGQVVGKDTKGTVIGAAAGAAAGAGAAAATANYEGCVPSGGRIVIRLDDSAQIRTE